MADIPFDRELIEVVNRLTSEQQQQVLAFAESIARPRGTPGKLAVQYAREIALSDEDAEAMMQAIDEACEQVEDSPEVNLDE